ncbi:hypothetical protein CMI47_20375 [Candidatus Pacearchaeota archaeon]|nr:hypothetical protein [Candidatus Pacearchaeota archaeon]|tara:strand:+ start:1185 stop:1610 length:426 start_codon:yes stop_codon:yes gene_type:complete
MTLTDFQKRAHDHGVNRALEDFGINKLAQGQYQYTPEEVAQLQAMYAQQQQQYGHDGSVQYLMDSPGYIPPSQPQESKFRTALRAGPALGAVIGGVAGLKHPFSRAHRLLSPLLGASAGAGMGWLPDVFATGAESVKDLTA